MRRRELLVPAGAAVSLNLSGCLGGVFADGAPDEPPEYDCAGAHRPAPHEPAAGGDDAPEPAPYPDPPEALTASTAIEYVEAYERAYRQNSLVERHGDGLRHWGMRVDETRTDDGPEGAAGVSLSYTYRAETDNEVEDSPVLYVSYYVDDEVVVRAETDAAPDSMTLPSDAP